MVSKREKSFDERQIASRGIAFKYGFFSFIPVIILFAFIKDTFGISCDCVGEAFLLISIPYAITMSIFIVKDAYDPINSKPGVIIFSIMAICAVIFISMNIHDKAPLIDNRIITREGGLTAFYISWVVIAIIYWIKNIKDRKEE